MLMTDDLLEWRPQFSSIENCVHFISHSLGCMPDKARDHMAEFLRLWSEDSIEAWNTWLPEVDVWCRGIERLLSAPENTVILHQNVSQVQSVLASCFDYTEERNKIVYSELNFPTVSYVWKAEERRGAKVHIVKSDDGLTIDTQKICDAIDEHTVAVPISHVLFSTSYIQDAKAICRKANSVGAHVILDCYQSLGTIPVDIVDIGASFACGGSVKYLCGGAGAAYLYARKDLIPKFAPRITGWFGHQAPFAFTMPDQQYAEGMWRYIGGTPAIAALYQAKAGQNVVQEIGAMRIREKSLRLTQKAIDWVDESGFNLNSPRDRETRAGSVIFDFAESAQVKQILCERKFFCDHRPGAGIRMSPHFYTKDEEVDEFFEEVLKIRGKR